MNFKKILSSFIICFSAISFAQNSITEIETDKGIRYITTDIDYQVTGTYSFKGAEPIVVLNSDGTGIYQLHDQPQRTMIWGMECNKNGELKFVKGFDNVKYFLFYKYNSSLDAETEEKWNKVDFTIHLNSLKMFINGERAKNFTPKE
ncbi:hypothetical protein [Flavobacterium capsici]|uniref:DUF4450 domain-containing protein n=1 Tax=Flavobacterium capsici TaxID=3075618 RepID=A0AA96F0C0_9FLAO|nr:MULTISPECIES: hypothetical protein [unclassified Flavobacterium]WNM18830.1 hypothetical protein RN608_12555 [Flavobacterium sp. PMR2A8]WNM22881.1 hypothetical protein RN605_05855 [Flavobacterium sp. PMTSA4]